MKRIISENNFNFITGIILVCLLVSLPYSQTIFPGLTGDELIDSLTARYKPANVLSYTEARNVMFTILHNQDDSVECIYTGFTIFLDHTSQNPIQQALAQGVDTEHTWPQSLGATGLAKSDLHHLFPVRAVVNSSRGNLPFDESIDPQTDKWFRENYMLTSIPSQFVDEYSELQTNLLFEPREDHKGNTARAMFYFYTMYSSQASQTYFNQQKSVLRLWNVSDPVDADELLRNTLISAYQEGKENPFILDTTLIRRAYFNFSGFEYQTANPQKTKAVTLLPNYPNPFNNETVASFYLNKPGRTQIRVVDLQGRTVTDKHLGVVPEGAQQVHIQLNNQGSGYFFLFIEFEDQLFCKKILLMK